ncbi:MAG TPA: amidohydrolase family protein [Dehalococcoidia bacterium]|nr:amidohydrolase family protein [Dehalococcoidia bacterium]
MTIDVHAHVVPERFPPHPPGADERWPEMDHFEPGRARVMIAGRNFRTVTEGVWSATRRIEDMDREGVDVQVLSPMPELLSYWLPLEDSRVLAEHVNDYITRMVEASPGRFHGLGMVRLQDPDAAALDLEGVRARRLAGIEVGSNVLGRSLGDPRFLDFWKAVERAGLAVFVHALHPTMRDRFVGPEQVVNAVGFPHDTGLTIASLISGGTLQACPGLRMAFSHGGGSFPFVLPRLENAWSGAWNEGEPLVPGAAPSELRQALPESPSTYARRLYYDTLLFDRRAIRYLLDIMGASQLVIGTDYPFFPREQPVGATVRSLGLDATTLGAVETANALRFLGIAPAAQG